MEGLAVMKIQVGNLSDGYHEYLLEAKPTDFGLEEGFNSEILVNAVLDKTGNQIYLKADVRTHGSFGCDRCASPFEAPVSSKFQACYFTEGEEVVNVDPEELRMIPPGFSVIDITDDIRQTILLAIPLKLLCSDTCRGLCPQCGKNLNTGSCECSDTTVDSRWEKLREIQQNNLQDPS
ncbi:MAG: hypothetical protein HW407_150 [Bacteroidetes bacterium]|nr:hypothetical protein [Bacteroidota bacterium]